MLFSETLGREIVTTDTAETIGQVADFVIDPRSRSIVAISVNKSKKGDTVLWGAIGAFGADAVIVSGADVLGEPNEAVAALSGKARRLMDKRVLDATGVDLGTVADVEFDAETGQLITLRLTEGAAIAGQSLIGIGSYAAVVHPPPAGAASSPT
ncbi:MAG: PRC-barrel domain-containing protein [Pedococcus sp.]